MVALGAGWLLGCATVPARNELTQDQAIAKVVAEAEQQKVPLPGNYETSVRKDWFILEMRDSIPLYHVTFTREGQSQPFLKANVDRRNGEIISFHSE